MGWMSEESSSLLRCREQFSSSLKYTDWLRSIQALFSGYRKRFPLVERDWGMKTHHSPPPWVKVKNVCSYSNTLSYAFLACRGTSLFTQKCGKLYSSFEFTYFPNMLLMVSITHSLMFTYCWPKCIIPKVHAIHKTRFYFFCMSFNIQCIKQWSKQNCKP